jgi:hypothetical protein
MPPATVAQKHVRAVHAYVVHTVRTRDCLCTPCTER